MSVEHIKMTVGTSGFVKNEHTYGKKVARNGRITVIYVRVTFISDQSLLWIFIVYV
jgi:ribosomal protein L36